MLYTKEYLTGKSIDLRQDKLGIIRQFKVDEFMDSYDLIDFIKPFYLEQSLNLNEEIKTKNVHFTTFYLLAQEDEKIMIELIKSLMFLYDIDDEKDENVKLLQTEDGFVLLLKKDDKAIVCIDDSNFNKLSEVILEMCHFDKPESEKEMKGDPKLIKRMKEARKRFQEEHKDKNTLNFEELVRQVMHIRKITYDEIKSWTIWQVKDVYIVESLMDASDKSYLLATNSNASVDLKKVKRWQEETKLVRE